VNLFILYFKNLGIALWRVPRSILGIYKYSTDDGYVKNVLVTLDCLGNTLAFGDPDETISSRSSKAELYEQSTTPPSWGWGCRMCSFLAIFQENHCAKALERNKGHRAVVPDAE
jgi:hypothetical protein